MAARNVRNEKGATRGDVTAAEDVRAERRESAMGTKVYRLKVHLESHGDVWRAIELRGEQTLEDLHYAIQVAFHWDNDHPYAFFLSGRYWDKRTCYVSPREAEAGPSEGSAGRALRVTTRAVLDRLGLHRGKAFAYLFDYGDEWRHRIKVLEIGPAQEGEDYPRIVSQSGVAPDQYPRQERAGDPRPGQDVCLLQLGKLAPLAGQADIEMMNSALQGRSRERLLKRRRLALELSAACAQDKAGIALLEQFLRGELRGWLCKLQKDLAEEGLIQELVQIAPFWRQIEGSESLLADRALILAKAGLAEEARRQVVEIQEQFPIAMTRPVPVLLWAAHITAGEALEIVGDLAAAEAHYRRCLKDLEEAKRVRCRNHCRPAVLTRLIPLLRRSGKKAEAEALETPSALETRVGRTG